MPDTEWSNEKQNIVLEEPIRVLTIKGFGLLTEDFDKFKSMLEQKFEACEH